MHSSARSALECIDTKENNNNNKNNINNNNLNPENLQEPHRNPTGTLQKPYRVVDVVVVDVGAIRSPFLFCSTITCTLQKPYRKLTETPQKPYRNPTETPQKPHRNPTETLEEPYRNLKRASLFMLLLLIVTNV